MRRSKKSLFGKKLHASQVEEIIECCQAGCSQTELARTYKVSVSMISLIWLNKCWVWVPSSEYEELLQQERKQYVPKEEEKQGKANKRKGKQDKAGKFQANRERIQTAREAKLGADSRRPGKKKA